MHFSIISKVLGILLMLFSITQLPPAIVAQIYGEQEVSVFLNAFLITLVSGCCIWLPVCRSKNELRTRDGFLVTVLFWTVLASFGAIPLYMLDSLNLSITDAFFESLSGLTTTGATVGGPSKSSAIRVLISAPSTADWLVSMRRYSPSPAFGLAMSIVS